jgi:DNA-binding MarR family transcriptional regulator
MKESTTMAIGDPEASARDRVLAALVAHPWSTTRMVAHHGLIGRSTASTALAEMEKGGLAVREAWPVGEPLLARRKPVIWVVTDAGRSAHAATGPARRVRRKDALAKGELRGMVGRWLTEHPDQEITPTRLATLLDRSSGAVFYALRWLCEQGAVTRTRAKPCTYKTRPAALPRPCRKQPETNGPAGHT